MEQYKQEAANNLAAGTLVIICFSAEWCGPCRGLHPILEKIASESVGKKIAFFEVNVDEQKEFTAEMGVRSIPVVHFMKEGVSVDKIVGLSRKEIYEDTIKKHLTVWWMFVRKWRKPFV